MAGRVIEGYYRCPFPFLVEVDALSEAYPIHVGDHTATLTLPSADGVTCDDPALRAPKWYYPGAPGGPRGMLPEGERSWGAATNWNHDETPMWVQIEHFRICFEVDVDATFEGGRAVAEALPGWWATVSAWVEVLYQQDLSGLGPVAPGVHYNGTTLWTASDEVGNDVVRVGSMMARVNMRRYPAINAADLQRCITIAQAEGPPATAWLVLRDARSFFSGYDFRRAVLDAGLATELAVTQMTSDRLADKGRSAETSTMLKKNRGLTKLCALWVKEGGKLPSNYQSRLITRRNDATHKGARISRREAEEAIKVAAAIVDQARPLSGYY